MELEMQVQQSKEQPEFRWLIKAVDSTKIDSKYKIILERETEMFRGSGVPRGGFGVFKPPPKIPKISVESSIAQARRTGVSISFCSSLCSHTVVIY